MDCLESHSGVSSIGLGHHGHDVTGFQRHDALAHNDIFDITAFQVQVHVTIRDIRAVQLEPAAEVCDWPLGPTAYLGRSHNEIGPSVSHLELAFVLYLQILTFTLKSDGWARALGTLGPAEAQILASGRG